MFSILIPSYGIVRYISVTVICVLESGTSADIAD